MKIWPKKGGPPGYVNLARPGKPGTMEDKLQHILVMEKLVANGHEAWLVGGAVRDRLMDAIPRNYDISTDAHITEIAALFPYALEEEPLWNGGKRMSMDEDDGTPIYVSPFISATDVQGETITEDLAHRDATINAIALSVDGTIVDPYGGVADTNHEDTGIVRAIGAATNRIEESPIRLMRYIRMSHGAVVKLHESLMEEIVSNRDMIVREDWADIGAEFRRGMMTDSPSDYIVGLEWAGLLPILLPEVQATGEQQLISEENGATVLDHTLGCLLFTYDMGFPGRLATLLHDVGKPGHVTMTNGVMYFPAHEERSATYAGLICDRFGYSAYTRKLVTLAIRHHHNDLSGELAIFRMIKSMDRNYNAALLVVGIQRCELFETGEADAWEDGAVKLDLAEDFIKSLRDKDKDVPVSALDINGNDVMKHLGIEPGEIVGSILSSVAKALSMGRVKNKKEELLALASTEYEPDKLSNPDSE